MNKDNITLIKVDHCHCGQKYEEPKWYHKGCQEYYCSNCYEKKVCNSCQGTKKSLLDDCANKDCVRGRVIAGFKPAVIESMEVWRNQ